MRQFAGVLSILLVGCASTPDIARQCTVFEDVGGKSTPTGLIIPQPELAQGLLQLLPENERNDFVCWYTSGDQFVVTGRRAPGAFVYGYYFTREEGEWRLVDDLPVILSWTRPN